MKIEAQGGHVYAATEAGPNGHAKTIISFEVEAGKLPFIGDLSRPLLRAELEAVMCKVAEVSSGSTAADKAATAATQRARLLALAEKWEREAGDQYAGWSESSMLNKCARELRDVK